MIALSTFISLYWLVTTVSALRIFILMLLTHSSIYISSMYLLTRYPMYAIPRQVYAFLYQPEPHHDYTVGYFISRTNINVSIT